MYSGNYSLPSKEIAYKMNQMFNGEIEEIAKRYPNTMQEVCCIYMMLGNKKEVEKCLEFGNEMGDFSYAYICAEQMILKNVLEVNI